MIMNQEKILKAGFAKVCINPPFGAPILGYYKPRFVKGVLDNLYARAVVFANGEKSVAIVTLDLAEVPKFIYDAMRREISKVTGMDIEGVFINCSHTHTGPVVGKDFASDKKSTDTYNDFLVTSAVSVVSFALDNMKICHLESATAQAKNISFVRRFRMKDGSVATNPGVNNPDILHALDTPNETVTLLKVVREGAKDIFMVNFGTHPDSVGGEYISADYMGFVCDILEKAVPDIDCMFLLGPQGDVNHVNVHPTKGESAISEIDFDSVPRSIKHAEHMGRVIAGAVLSVCSITEKVEGAEIAYVNKMVDLPSNQENDKLEESKRIYKLYEEGRESELPFKEMALTTAIARAKRIISLENGPESFPFLLSAIKVGGAVFAGVGGEPFSEIGRRINAVSPFDVTVLCCLTNNAGGYIPTTKAYDEGGYEAGNSALKPGGDDIIVNAMQDVFEQIK